MSYEVNRTNPNNPPINVDMSTTKKQLGLTWVGQYYSRYGEIQSENFLRLLENFASDTQPNSEDDTGLAIRNVLGQLWYNTFDSGNSLGKVLKIYNGNRHSGTDGWKRLEPIISNTEPTVHTEGEIWYKPSSNTFSISRGTRWEQLTVLLAEDSKKLGGLLPDQFIRSDIDDTVYGVLRTNEIFPDRHKEFDLGKAGNRWETIYAKTLDVEDSHDIVPEFTDTHDLGIENKRWRNGYFSLIDSINFRNANPLINNTYTLGTTNRKWLNAHIRDAYLDNISTFRPLEAGSTIGTSTTRWSTAFINVLDTSFSKDLIPQDNLTYNLGSSARRWSNIYVNVIRGTTNTETLQPRVNGAYDLGTSSKSYGNLFINTLKTDITSEGDITFDIVQNGKSKGINWNGLSDSHSIYVEETTNTDSTRLVIENGDNSTDHTLFKGYYGDIARFKSTEVEVVAGVLKTKGSMKVESTSSTSGCEMVYNNANETLDFIFY